MLQSTGPHTCTRGLGWPGRFAPFVSLERWREQVPARAWLSSAHLGSSVPTASILCLWPWIPRKSALPCHTLESPPLTHSGVWPSPPPVVNSILRFCVSSRKQSGPSVPLPEAQNLANTPPSGNIANLLIGLTQSPDGNLVASLGLSHLPVRYCWAPPQEPGSEICIYSFLNKGPRCLK